MPRPELKEEIVRTNTNRLNRVSWWYCLDNSPNHLLLEGVTG
jgi:hypothetical protein